MQVSLQPLLVHSPPLTIDTRDFLRRDDVFLDISPSKPHECRVGTEQADGDKPPDLPDQGETRNGGEESGNETLALFFGISIGS